MFNLQDPKLDDAMREQLSAVADRAAEHGVTPENMNLFLYIDNFLDDMCKECFPVPLTGEERTALISHMMKDCDPKDLHCFRASIARYLQNKKVAYPTILQKNYRPHGFESHWPDLLVQIGRMRSQGVDTAEAIRRAANQIPELEHRLRFLTWYGMKFQEGRNLSYLAAEEKMSDISKIASYLDEDPYVYEFKKRLSDSSYEAPKLAPDPQAAEDFETLRSKMVSRTFAIDKLLEKYRDVLNEVQFEEIEDSLNDLRKKMRKLKHATLSDVLTKKANQFSKMGWQHGAVALSVIACDGIFEKVASIDEPQQMQEIVTKLEQIASDLRQRTIIRELSAIDIDLFNIGFGHISEVQDASAKLMEAYNSAANKLEDVAGKLRSDLQQQTAPRTEPTKIKPIVNPQDLPLAKVFEGDTAEELPELSEVAPEIESLDQPAPIAPEEPAPTRIVPEI